MTISFDKEFDPSLVTILSQLPRICKNSDFQMIDDEWRHLPFYGIEGTMKNLETVVFWGKMLNLKNDGEEYLFRNLSQVVLNVLSLPQFNADSERLFSKINLMKTKIRNKLIVPTARGLLLASQRVKYSGGCPNFTPSKDMLSRMTSTTLYGEKRKTASHNLVEEKSNESGDDEIIFKTG